MVQAFAEAVDRTETRIDPHVEEEQIIVLEKRGCRGRIQERLDLRRQDRIVLHDVGRGALPAGEIQRLQMRPQASQAAGVCLDGAQTLVVAGQAKALELGLHMPQPIAVAIEVDEQPVEHG
jgi:hypothetical protein